MRFFLLALLAIACFATSSPETTADAECSACIDEENDANACFMNNCLGDCMTDLGEACFSCIGNKCGNELTDSTRCEYDNGCADLDTCSACSDKEANLSICMMNMIYKAKCGFTTDQTENPEDMDFACIMNECGSEIEAGVGCDYTNCQGSDSYDVWRSTSFCGDGTSCDGDCTQVSGEALTFGECNSDDDDDVSSWSAVCNDDDNSVTVSQYLTTSDCSGVATVTELTQGGCANLEDDTSIVFMYNWYGGCGGDTYVAPSSTSSLLVALLFVISFVLY